MSERNDPPKRRSKRGRLLRRYAPSAMLVLLAAVCVGAVAFTVGTISSMIQTSQPTEPVLETPPATTEPKSALSAAEIDALIAQAEGKAMTYDYQGAIALLQSVPEYEKQEAITDKIEAYTQASDQLVPYEDMDNITHVFFHSLIVDPSRAFDGDEDQNGYNLYMTTIYEFEKILESMYERGYVLVSPYDIAYEVQDANGAHFEYGEILLPEGKTPFLMSQDDVNYYSYMIGTGSGKDETPVFADTNGDGFASRIVIGEDGYPTCEYMDASGQILYGDYDLVPILERFIQEHPDFSYHGARAILGVTGYEGVFGYRTKPSYETALGTEAYQEEVAQAKAVAQCLREHGWIIASHSYGHPAYGEITAEKVAQDSDKWLDTVGSIVGETDILLFPYGSDINSYHMYTQDNEKFTALYEDGFRYFFNVDSKVAWTQIGDTYYRGSRRNLDGYRMYHYPDKLADLFDAGEVLDPERPLPVPGINSAPAK